MSFIPVQRVIQLDNALLERDIWILLTDEHDDQYTERTIGRSRNLKPQSKVFPTKIVGADP